MPGDMYLSLQCGSIPTSPFTITQDQPHGYLPGVEGRRVLRSPHQPPRFAPAAGSGRRAQRGSPITAAALWRPATSTVKKAAGLCGAAGQGQDLHHSPHGAWSRGTTVTPVLAAGADPVQHQTPLPHAASLLPPHLPVVPIGSLVPLQVFHPSLVLAEAIPAPVPCPCLFPDGSVRRGKS